jgi:hypothetical protein
MAHSPKVGEPLKIYFDENKIGLIYKDFGVEYILHFIAGTFRILNCTINLK